MCIIIGCFLLVSIVSNIRYESKMRELKKKIDELSDI